MKIRVWYFVSDGGDGSVYVHHYATEAEATAAAEQELDEYGQVLDEAVGYLDVEVADMEVVG